MRRLTIGCAGQLVAGAIRRAMPLGALGWQGLDHGGGLVFPPFRVKDGACLQPVFRQEAGRSGRTGPADGQVICHAPINAWFRPPIP